MYIYVYIYIYCMYVCAGDTRPSRALEELGRDATILIHEVSPDIIIITIVITIIIIIHVCACVIHPLTAVIRRPLTTARPRRPSRRSTAHTQRLAACTRRVGPGPALLLYICYGRLLFMREQALSICNCVVCCCCCCCCMQNMNSFRLIMTHFSQRYE